MAMNEDFSAFFNTNEHAVVFTYAGNDYKGIFEKQFVSVNGVESVKPTLLCAEADVSIIGHNAIVTIDSYEWQVKGHQPDGTGLILLIFSDKPQGF